MRTSPDLLWVHAEAILMYALEYNSTKSFETELSVAHDLEILEMTHNLRNFRIMFIRFVNLFKILSILWHCFILNTFICLINRSMGEHRLAVQLH